MIEKQSDSPKLCKAPWSLLTIDPSGFITLCCHSSGFPLQHINEVDSLKHFFNSDKYQDVRQRFLNGQFPSNCQVCEVADKTPPMEQKFIQSLPWMDEQLTASNKKILALEYTASNLCNQTCATCGSRFSSKWLNHDRKAMEQGLNFRKDSLYVDLQQKQEKTKSKNVQKVFEILPDLKLLIFKGGEPLADPKTRDILQEIVDNNYKCSVLIVSNLSLIDEKWFDLFKKIKKNGKLIIVGSVDGTGDVYEWIRGSRWQETERTIRNFQKILGEPLQLNISVSLFNFFTLPEDLHKLDELNATRNIRFTIVTDPWYTSANLLSFEQRKDQVEKIYQGIDSIQNLTILNAPVLKDLLKNKPPKEHRPAIQWIQFLNSMRKRDFFELVPELKTVLNIN